MVGLAEVNRYLSNPVKALSSIEAKRALESFVSTYNSIEQSSKDEIDDPAQDNDNLNPLLRVITDPNIHQKCPADTLANLLVILRILLRKEGNRLGNIGLSRKTIKAVIDIMREPKSSLILKECFRVVLQMCYEHKNVLMYIELGGISHLVRYLGKLSDEDLQAPLLGAIQSISYQSIGRLAVRQHHGIKVIVPFLGSRNDKVRTRAVGALHNLTADPKTITSIRVAGAIPLLVHMLRSSNKEICSAAAGALQNLSREKLSRALIEEIGAIEPLADLLSCRDVHCQTCAAGALYNVLVPGFEGKPEALACFKALVSDTIVLGAIRSCLEDDDDDQENIDEHDVR